MLNFSRRALALVFVLLLIASGAASEKARPAFRIRESRAAENAMPKGFLNGLPYERISLRQAINMALENNLEARFDSVGIRVEHARVRFEAGAFDPAFSFQMSRDSLRRLENANDISSTEALRQERAIEANIALANAVAQQNALLTGTPFTPISRTDVSTGIQGIIFDQQVDRSGANFIQRTPWGMRYGFFIEANRIRNTFTGDLRPVFPEYQAQAQVQVVQPLLKDFGPAANLANLRVARINKKVAILTWKQRVITGVHSVMATYYDMLYALADVQVRQDAIAADEKLVQQNQRRMELGFMQPFDVQQARAQVSLDQEQLLVAKNLFMERQFLLKRLILEQFDVNDASIYVPLKEPALAVPSLDRSAFLRLAFEKRPDFKQALLEADSQDVRLRFARNQLLPQLDMVGSYGVNGLDNDYGSSFAQAFRGHTAFWSAGVNLRFPLGNVQARSQLDLVKAQKEQALLRIKQTELTIGVDVDTVISRIETNRQRLDTARKTRELNEEAVRIAYRRLEEGQISSFDIIEQQRKLYDARSRELQARAELNKGILQLWLATGTVLDRVGVRIQEEEKE